MPRGGDEGYSDSGSLANFFSGLVFFISVSELLSFVSPPLRSSACRGTDLETVAVSVRLDAARPNANRTKQTRVMQIIVMGGCTRLPRPQMKPLRLIA